MARVCVRAGHLEVVVGNGDGERGPLSTTGDDDRRAGVSFDATIIDLDGIPRVDQDRGNVAGGKVRCDDPQIGGAAVDTDAVAVEFAALYMRQEVEVRVDPCHLGVVNTHAGDDDVVRPWKVEPVGGLGGMRSLVRFVVALKKQVGYDVLGGVVVLAKHLGGWSFVEAAAKVEHRVHCAAGDQGGVRGSLSSELDGSVGAAGAAGAQESPGVVVAARRAAATWGDNSHSATGPGCQDQGVSEGVSVGYTGS